MFLIRCDVCGKEQEVLPVKQYIPAYIPPDGWFPRFWHPKDPTLDMQQLQLCSLECLREHHNHIVREYSTGRSLDELDNEDFSGRPTENEEEE